VRNCSGPAPVKMFVTPAQAAEWLAATDNSFHAHPVSQATVDALAGKIRRGAWRWRGHRIIIERGGGPINGRHRLAAIVQANMGVWIKVAFASETG
jgi:hypothetical protein